jgi:hypothetical protein
MATNNKGVMVYLPSEVEAKMVEYCTEYNITRKDKQGNIVTSLGSGIVAYLKSQLLGDIPRSASDRPTPGLTRAEVLDLIVESSTSNTPIVGVASPVENRSPDLINADFVHRLEEIEQKLSSSKDISTDEVEQLIQASEQKIMNAVRSLSIELRGESIDVKTIDDRVNTPQPLSFSPSQDLAIEDTVKSLTPDTNNSATPDRKPMSKDIRRWLEPLKDKKFGDIIQTGISDKWSNQEIVSRLFDAGYGKNDNTEPYPTNLASAMKTAWDTANNRSVEDL